MKTFLKNYGGWLYVPILIISIIVFSIENSPVEMSLVILQTILIAGMIYGVILLRKDNKEKNKKFVIQFGKQIEALKQMELPDEIRDEMIKICEDQINTLTRKKKWFRSSKQ